MCTEDAKIMFVLKGSGKEKFVDCSCYKNCFLESEETLGGDGRFRILQMVAMSQCPESPADAQISSRFMRKWLISC